MYKYFYVKNTGHGFITHQENEIAHIAEYPGNIFVTTNVTWAIRVNAVEKTKEEAQAIVDAAIAAATPPPDQPNTPAPIILP